MPWYYKQTVRAEYKHILEYDFELDDNNNNSVALVVQMINVSKYRWYQSDIALWNIAKAVEAEEWENFVDFFLIAIKIFWLAKMKIFDGLFIKKNK